MLFCPNCDNVLNISKNPPQKKQFANPLELNTPESISDIEENKTDNETTDNDNITINKLANGELVSDLSIGEIKIEQLTKNKTYQKLDKKKKNQVLSTLTSFHDKIDDAISAYYFCKNCMYSKAIDAGSLIVSRINSGSSNYINLGKLENRKYSNILPITRNYICSNKKCLTNDTGANRKPREAVFYRINGSMQAWYTCRVCGNYWKGQ